jgi:hypothetical protein
LGVTARSDESEEEGWREGLAREGEERVAERGRRWQRGKEESRKRFENRHLMSFPSLDSRISGVSKKIDKTREI